MNHKLFKQTDRAMRLPNLKFKRGGGRHLFKPDFSKRTVCQVCGKRKGRKPCGECDRLELRVEYNQANREEIFSSLYKENHNPFITQRMNEYLEETTMADKKFLTKGHQARFERKLKSINKKNKSLVAAVYLLTVENAVWKQCWNKVFYDNMEIRTLKLKESGKCGYTYFCAAKDIYNDSKYLTVDDLGDRDIIPRSAFGIISNALAISRYGLNSLYTLSNGRGDDKYVRHSH